MGDGARIEVASTIFLACLATFQYVGSACRILLLQRRIWPIFQLLPTRRKPLKAKPAWEARMAIGMKHG